MVYHSAIKKTGHQTEFTGQPLLNSDVLVNLKGDSEWVFKEVQMCPFDNDSASLSEVFLVLQLGVLLKLYMTATTSTLNYQKMTYPFHSWYKEACQCVQLQMDIHAQFESGSH